MNNYGGPQWWDEDELADWYSGVTDYLQEFGSEYDDWAQWAELTDEAWIEAIEADEEFQRTQGLGEL